MDGENESGHTEGSLNNKVENAPSADCCGG